MVAYIGDAPARLGDPDARVLRLEKPERLGLRMYQAECSSGTTTCWVRHFSTGRRNVEILGLFNQTYAKFWIRVSEKTRGC
jgi:hypothetical protein